MGTLKPQSNEPFGAARRGPYYCTTWPNVTARPSTASVPISYYSLYSMWHYNCLCTRPRASSVYPCCDAKLPMKNPGYATKDNVGLIGTVVKGTHKINIVNQTQYTGLYKLWFYLVTKPTLTISGDTLTCDVDYNSIELINANVMFYDGTGNPIALPKRNPFRAATQVGTPCRRRRRRGFFTDRCWNRSVDLSFPRWILSPCLTVIPNHTTEPWPLLLCQSSTNSHLNPPVHR